MTALYSPWAARPSSKPLLAFLALAVLLLLQACTPALNWRVVPNSDLGYAATYPDKPVQVTRTLNLAGYSVPLTLQAAVAKDTYFAVGVVELTGPLDGKGVELKDALVKALANNIKLDELKPEQKEWAGLTAVDWAQGEGKLPDGRTAKAMGRFFIHHNKLYEVLAVGPTDQLDKLVETQWFSGFKLLGL